MTTFVCLRCGNDNIVSCQPCSIELQKEMETLFAQEQEAHEKTKQELKDANAVIDFYGQTEVWGTALPGDETSIDPSDWSPFRLSYKGGKRARQHREKYPRT